MLLDLYSHQIRSQGKYTRIENIRKPAIRCCKILNLGKSNANKSKTVPPLAASGIIGKVSESKYKIFHTESKTIVQPW